MDWERRVLVPDHLVRLTRVIASSVPLILILILIIHLSGVGSRGQQLKQGLQFPSSDQCNSEHDYLLNIFLP